jgi:hypothetical protein
MNPILWPQATSPCSILGMYVPFTAGCTHQSFWVVPCQNLTLKLAHTSVTHHRIFKNPFKILFWNIFFILNLRKQLLCRSEQHGNLLSFRIMKLYLEIWGFCYQTNHFIVLNESDRELIWHVNNFLYIWEHLSTIFIFINLLLYCTLQFYH